MSEPKRIKVKEFSEWTERIKSEAIFARPEGNLVIPIRAVSDEERVKITTIYRDLLPAPVAPSFDRDGNIRNNAVNKKAEDAATEQKLHAANVMQMLYIEKGCDWEIPGANNDEKLKALQQKVAGEIERLYTEILRLSKLTDDDISFF